jgi:ABC-type glycerol-3-phosphate transport system substrate-binding protein
MKKMACLFLAGLLGILITGCTAAESSSKSGSDKSAATVTTTVPAEGLGLADWNPEDDGYVRIC